MHQGKQLPLRRLLVGGNGGSFLPLHSLLRKPQQKEESRPSKSVHKHGSHLLQMSYPESTPEVSHQYTQEVHYG